ncbi:MAG: ATP-binding protein [Actinomycetota bacterium]
MRKSVRVVIREVSELAETRAKLRRCLAFGDVDAETCTDVQLAATEMITNGLGHTDHGPVGFEADVHHDRVELVVRHPDGEQVRRTAPLVTPFDIGGNGLQILQDVSTRLSSNHRDGHRTTSVTLERQRLGTTPPS